MQLQMVAAIWRMETKSDSVFRPHYFGVCSTMLTVNKSLLLGFIIWLTCSRLRIKFVFAEDMVIITGCWTSTWTVRRRTQAGSS